MVYLLIIVDNTFVPAKNHNIIAATGASIDIQDDGTVLIASTEAAKSAEAIRMIRAITDDVEVGRVYFGKVKRIMPFGAFCEIAPGKEGLVHVSELSSTFVKDVNSVVKLSASFLLYSNSRLASF